MADKADLLLQCRRRLRQVADRWVAATNAARGLAPDSPWAAEEWYEVYTVSRALRAFAHSLRAIANGDSPAPRSAWTRPDGQDVLRLFPDDWVDWLLFNGMTVETWLQPGVKLENLAQHVGVLLKDVALLGDGAGPRIHTRSAMARPTLHHRAGGIEPTIIRIIR